MRQQRKVTGYVVSDRLFRLKPELNVPGSVVEIDGCWYRIGRSGTWYRASSEEIEREKGLLAASFLGKRLA